MTLQRIATSLLVFTLGVFLLPTAAHAQTIEEQYQDILDQGIIFAGICTGAEAECECRDYGICSLDNILQVGVNVIALILALSGTILLFIFTYGGMVWIASNGRPDWVTKGKQSMVGAVAGLGIILSAYVVISLIISVLKTGEPPSQGETLEEIIGGSASDTIQTQE